MPKGGLRASWLARCAVVVSLGVQPARAAAQSPVLRSPVPPEIRSALKELAGQAEVIFAGQVVSVTRGGGAESAGWVEIEFRVERALRGCTALESYRVREWAGVWAAQSDRYRVGRRLLMLLTAPGRSGLSSPVGGQDGAIPLLATASAPIWSASEGAPADRAGTAGDPQGGGSSGNATDALVPDLRWVQARATRVTRPATKHSAEWAGPVEAMGLADSLPPSRPISPDAGLSSSAGLRPTSATGVGDSSSSERERRDSEPRTLGSARASALVRLRDVALFLDAEGVAPRAAR